MPSASVGGANLEASGQEGYPSRACVRLEPRIGPRQAGTPCVMWRLLCCALSVVLLASCGGDADEPSTSTAPPEAPAATVALSASDERRAALPSSGDRTTFRGRVTRDERPLRREPVELVADAHPFGDGGQVVARATTGADGRFVVRERFDRRTRVHATAGDGRSRAIALERTAALGAADIDEQPNGVERMTGTMRYPPDIEPRFRFRLFVGLGSQPRLAHRPAKAVFERLGPGRGRVSVRFRPPAVGWSARLCVFPAEPTGLSSPGAGCRGRTTPNPEFDRDDARRREQDAARERS